MTERRRIGTPRGRIGRLAVCLVAGALVAGAAAAQTVVGRSMIDGRQVELRDDGTWVYTDRPSGADDCRAVALGVSFCGAPGTWRASPPPNADVAAQYRYDDRHYSQFVIEGLGSEDGLTRDFMRNAVLQIAASITGTPVADIPVFGIEPAEVDGKAGETILYLVSVDGVSVVYSNTIVSMPRRTVQAMSFAIGGEYTDELADVHRQFLSNVRISQE